MKILITGGAGFIGSNVANHLRHNHDVTVIDNLSFGYADNLPDGVKFIQKSFAEIEDLNYDVLVHCACANIIYAMDEPVKTVKTNALDSIKLFDRFNGKIVYTSTASVYGQARVIPTPEDHPYFVSNAYDISKLIAEWYLKSRGNFTTLRLSNVYGPGQRASNPYAGVVSKFIDAGIKGEELFTFGSGTDTRDYTYINDVVLAIEKAVELRAMDTEINISTASETSINELIFYISKELNIHPHIRVSDKRSIDKISRRMLDNVKAKILMGWVPKTDLLEGIKLTVEHEKDK